MGVHGQPPRRATGTVGAGRVVSMVNLALPVYVSERSDMNSPFRRNAHDDEGR
jgi:hypothetical protein